MANFTVYLDGNIWQELSLDFDKNKKLHSKVWKIFEQQRKGKIDICSSDIHRAEFLRKDEGSFADRHSPEIVEKKIQQCFEKSNRKVKTILALGNSTLGNSSLATKDESDKFNELNDLLLKTSKDPKNPFDAHHLLTCFINNIDAFITRDNNILNNWIEIKKLFTKWGKKNFIIASPEGYLRLHGFISYSTLLLALVPVAVFFKVFLNLSYFDMFLGYGLMGNFLLIYEIIGKISKFELNKKNKIAIGHVVDFFRILVSVYYPVFALFTALILALANKGIIDEVFSSVWLLLLIFAFQIPVLYGSLYLLSKKYSKRQIIYIFMFLYLVLSAIFGWTSAYVDLSILKLSTIPDLVIATYGTLILLFVTVKYFENQLDVY